MEEPPVPGEDSPIEALPVPDPRRAELGLALVLTLALLFLFITVGAVTQLLHPAFGLWFTEVFLFFGVTWFTLRLTGRDPVAYPRLGTPGWPALALGFAAGAANFAGVVVQLQTVTQKLLPKKLLEMFDASRLFEGQLPAELALIAGAVCVAAPICEEYFFRGVLQRSLLGSGMRAGAALFVTAVVFSFFHLDPVGFLSRVELGALFGFLALRTGSLWPGVAAHAANNMISMAAYFASAQSPEAAEDEGPAWPWLLGASLVFVPLLALVLHRISTREPIPAPPARDRGPVKSREVVAWLGAALLSILLLAAVDGRGVVLNVLDTVEPIDDRAEMPKADREKLDALKALRAQVRRRKAPFSEYRTERASLSRELRELGKKPPSAPAPSPAPAPPRP